MTSRPMPMIFAWPGVLVVGDVTVVFAVVGFGHQHLDVLADHFRGRKAEDALGRWVEGHNRAAVVDGDDAVKDVVDDRAHPLHGLNRFACPLLHRLGVGGNHTIDSLPAKNCSLSNIVKRFKRPVKSLRRCAVSAHAVPGKHTAIRQ